MYNISRYLLSISAIRRNNVKRKKFRQYLDLGKIWLSLTKRQEHLEASVITKASYRSHELEIHPFCRANSSSRSQVNSRFVHLTRRDLEPRLTITFSTNFNRIRFSNVVIKMKISALKGGGYFQRVYQRFVKNSDGLFFFRDINFTNDVLTMYPRLILLHPTILLPIISPYYKVSRNLLFFKNYAKDKSIKIR